MSRPCCNGDGKPKRPYDSAARARESRRRIRKEERGVVAKALSVYRCPECGWWHIGHRPGSRKG